MLAVGFPAVWWTFPIAVAAVRVDPIGTCLGAEALDLEVRGLLGDDVVDGLDLLARVDGSGPFQVEVRVADGDRLLWSKSLSVEQGDCPLLPALLARSVERGLSDLPGWQLGVDRVEQRAELGFFLAGTLPLAPRFGLGARSYLVVAGPLRWATDLEGFWSTIEPVGTGGAQISAIVVGSGPAVRLPAGRDAVQLGARFVAGPAIVVGHGFDENLVSVAPRVGNTGEIVFASRTGLRVGLRLDVPWVRLVYAAPGSRETTIEAPVRGGLVLGLESEVRRGEGREDERP